MNKATYGLVVGLSVSILGYCGTAAAGTPLTVQIDQSQLLTLEADPGTIIIGNPSIADVSLNGKQMYIHGHSFGETNLMIFDASGNKMSEFELTVGNSPINQVTVYRGNGTSTAQRQTYSCAPTCEAAMMAGDNNLSQVIGDNRSKADFANGVKSSDLVPKATGAPPQ